MEMRFAAVRYTFLCPPTSTIATKTVFATMCTLAYIPLASSVCSLCPFRYQIISHLHIGILLAEPPLPCYTYLISLPSKQNPNCNHIQWQKLTMGSEIITRSRTSMAIRCNIRTITSIRTSIKIRTRIGIRIRIRTETRIEAIINIRIRETSRAPVALAVGRQDMLSIAAAEMPMAKSRGDAHSKDA